VISRLTFLKKYRVFEAGETFEFRQGVNLIVGDQGAGKTSLLEAIGGELYEWGERQSLEKLATIRKIELTVQKEKFQYFDFEKENPRTKKMTFHSAAQTIAGLSSRTKSHGETIWHIMESAEEASKVKIWLFDEPDAALSIRSCHRLAEGLRRISEKNKAQILVTAHSPILIGSFEEVLSIEHKRWMPSQEFIAAHTTEFLKQVQAEARPKRRIAKP